MDLFRSNVMENSDIAGLISITVSFSDKTISELQDRNIPIVFVDKYVDYGKCVYVDNEKAIFNAVTKLISLNHKKIGFISPGPIGSGYDIWAERLNGYKRALNEHGIGYNPRLIENEGSFDLELIKIATKRLLEKNRDLSAIVFISDKTAIAGMKAVIESGRKIPDDISIIGFDDIEFDAYLTPSLSSIKQPAYEMGERASKMLYSAITKKDYKHESVRLNAELILRDSVKRIKKT